DPYILDIEAITGTGAVVFKVPGLFSTYPVLVQVGPSRHGPVPRRQVPRPAPPRIPVHVALEPTVKPLPIPEPILEPMAAKIDRRAAIALLFAAGEIDEAQLAALLAA